VALLPEPDARAAWRALAPDLDGLREDPAARRLWPALAAAVSRHGIDAAAAAPWLAAARRAAAERNRTLFAAGGRLLGALREAGIDTLVLKGGALALTRYEAPDLRPMADLDVLVPTARARAALDALGAAGWAPRVPVSDAFIRMQHAANLRTRGGEAKCDLHWHAYWECCHPGADDPLWAASRPLDFEGVATRVLGPADQLLHVCVNGSRRARRPTITWVADAVLVLRAGDVDWPRLVAEARERRVVLRARAMLGYLRARLDAPVPGPVLEELLALPVSRLERVEHRAGNRRAGVLGALPVYWCNYRRFRERAGPGAAPGFARYLQQVWRLASLREVARAALDRAGRRIRAAAGRPTEGPSGLRRQ